MTAEALIIDEPGAHFASRMPLVADCSVIANVAVKKARRGFEAIAGQALDLFADLRLTRYEVALKGQWALAVRHELSACDAAYLWLAAPLATFDRKLGLTTRQRFGDVGPI